LQQLFEKKHPEPVTGKKGLDGRKPGPVGAAERMARYRLMELCARHTEKVVAFYARVMDDEAMPVEVRMAAADRLLDRGYGKPLQALVGHQDAQVRHILNVRWLPPDPNDHSKVIEPEPVKLRESD
jgi:hypothetical protein